MVSNSSNGSDSFRDWQDKTVVKFLKWTKTSYDEAMKRINEEFESIDVNNVDFLKSEQDRLNLHHLDLDEIRDQIVESQQEKSYSSFKSIVGSESIIDWTRDVTSKILRNYYEFKINEVVTLQKYLERRYRKELLLLEMEEAIVEVKRMLLWNPSEFDLRWMNTKIDILKSRIKFFWH